MKTSHILQVCKIKGITRTCTQKSNTNHFFNPLDYVRVSDETQFRKLCCTNFSISANISGKHHKLLLRKKKKNQVETLVLLGHMQPSHNVYH